MEVVRFAASFGVAVLSLHGAWQAFGLAWADPRAERWLVLGVYLAALLASGAWAGYLVYAADRRAGRVRRRVGLYERWLATPRGGRGP
ncbi:MAG: hypothetical protein C4304_01655 [candidate division GAL15 bacterium]